MRFAHAASGQAALVALAYLVSPSAAYEPTVYWVKCPPLVPKPIECGQIKVPLDHSDPDGDKITLSLTRLRANNTCQTNPGLYIENGAPGATNADSMFGVLQREAAGFDTKYYSLLRRSYDIIGVDMRGTGSSQPVKCDLDLYRTVRWPMIKDQKTYEETMDKAKAWGSTCVNMTGALIHHMGTDQAVHDYEMVRRALHHDKFNYLGISYGTQLGSEYADIYPEKVGRMVLDGVVNRHLVEEDRITTSAAAFDSAMNDFFLWCNTTTDCAIHGQDQRAIFDWVIEAAARGELRSTGCAEGVCGDGSLVPDWQVLYTLEIYLHDYIIPGSRHNFQNASRMLNYTYVEKSGLAFQGASDPVISAQMAITCSDRRDRVLSMEDFRNIWTVAPALAPLTRGLGIASQFLTVCQGWPVKSLNPPRAFSASRQNQLPPVMLVNTLYDTATWASWGLGLRALMPTSFSVYRNGSGHSSFLQQGDTAAASVAFLVNGTVPKDGTIYQT